jgi:serine/threonine protein kinase
MSSSFIGKVVDNYRIIENLGIGGMGVVFKAIHVKLDKLFALKMIAPGLAMNENFIKRFQTEAKALAKFEDPNIVRIYDLREYNDQWFIVMEYVNGHTLLDIIRKEGAFPLQNALPILNQMLTAIGHAHSAGIIHRDLKPNNVMISTDGKVKITDFGLAKDQASMTTTLSVTSGGTLYYMSPEHVKGFQFTDKRSDIYSIGMTFYEMITGTVPFKDLQSDFDIRESIIRKDTIKPSVYNKNIPPELEDIVMKSIAKEPDDRYQSTEEMLNAVIHFEDENPNIDSKFVLMEIQESRKESVTKEPSEKAFLFSLKNSISPETKLWPKIGIWLSLLIVIIVLFYIFYPAPAENENRIDDLDAISHVSVISRPNAALITIENDSIGQTPLDYYSLQPGQYPVRISKDHYYSIDTTINLKPGNNLK